MAVMFFLKVPIFFQKKFYMLNLKKNFRSIQNVMSNVLKKLILLILMQSGFCQKQEVFGTQTAN